MTEFIFMLTRQDRTIEDALDVCAVLGESGVRYVGFKDIGAPEKVLFELTRKIHANNQVAVLEVVSESEEEEMQSAQLALRLGVDYLLGGRRAESVSAMIRHSAIKYFPFCGQTQGHPTRLTGCVDDIVSDALRLCSLEGVSGLDLLAYRFAGDVDRLLTAVCSRVSKPVVVAGSIDSFERISAVEESGAWGFTVGSAIFAGKFGSNSTYAQVLAILNRNQAFRIEQGGASAA